MNEETEVPVTEEDETVVPPIVEEELKSEEEEPKEEKEDFVKEDETVPAAKYNQAVRKLREAELEKRESEKQSPKVEKPKKPSKEEDDDDDIFKEEPDEDKLDVEALVEAKVKPVLERLNQKEAEERKNQRTAFFEEHPEYLTDAEAWQELLDELDNFNPNSKDNHYKQLTKAHRIISGEPKGNAAIDKKKREMASESASKGDGSQKAAERKSDVDERADRLARKMPIGFTYTGK